jgi:hypothetical protein
MPVRILRLKLPAFRAFAYRRRRDVGIYIVHLQTCRLADLQSYYSNYAEFKAWKNETNNLLATPGQSPSQRSPLEQRKHAMQNIEDRVEFLPIAILDVSQRLAWKDGGQRERTRCARRGLVSIIHMHPYPYPYPPWSTQHTISIHPFFSLRNHPSFYHIQLCVTKHIQRTSFVGLGARSRVSSFDSTLRNPPTTASGCVGVCGFGWPLVGRVHRPAFTALRMSVHQHL